MTLIQLPCEETNSLARNLVAKGEIIAFRTDTLYGLGVDPWNKKALRALKKLKGREEGKPTLILISDEELVTDFIASRTPIYELLSRTYFPGALTIIETARDEVPAELTANQKTIGVRIPADEAVRDFVRLCGGALTATSANLSGHPPSLTASQVAAYFTEGVSLVIDNGSCETTLASTLIDISIQPPQVLREGVITKEMLQTTLMQGRAHLK